MSLELEQHVFTSRRRFETVARSPGIDDAVCRVLERHAGSYPSGDWGADAPRVYRTFAVQPDGSSWAIMLVRNVPGDVTGRGGNYVAYTFVASQQTFEALGSNPAWIAANIPAPAYRPPAGSGVEKLPSKPLALDSRTHYSFLKFLVQEQSRDRVEQLVTRLLHHIAREEPDATLDIGFGNQHPDVAALLNAAWPNPSGEPRTVRSADTLNLFRCVGLFSILPRAFLARASFSINEPGPASGFTATVLRKGGAAPVTAPDQSVLPYVQRCLDLAIEGRLDLLEQLVTWVNGMLTAPSIGALNVALDLFHQIVEQSDASDLQRVRECLESVRPFAAALDPQPILDWLEPRLVAISAPPLERSTLLLPLLDILAKRPGRALSEKLGREVLAVLSAPGDGDLSQSGPRFRGLSEPMRVALWQQAEALGCLPAHVPADAPPSALAFCLEAADSLGPSLEKADVGSKVWERLRDRLWPRPLAPADAPGQTLALLRRLSSARATVLAATFIRRAAEDLGPGSRDSVSGRFLAATVLREGTFAVDAAVDPEVMATFLSSLGRRDDRVLTWPLLEYPPSTARHSMLVLLRALAAKLPKGRARDVAGLTEELLMIATGQGRPAPRGRLLPELSTPCFDAWMLDLRPRRLPSLSEDIMPLHNRFRRNVMTEISQADPRMAAIIGSVYSYTVERRDRVGDLLAAVTARLIEAPPKTARALLSRGEGLPYDGQIDMAKVIARLLVTAHADDLIFLGLLEALDRSFATTAAAFDAAASFTRDVDEHWRAHREPRPEWTRWCRERGLVAAKQTWRSER